MTSALRRTIVIEETNKHGSKQHFLALSLPANVAHDAILAPTGNIKEPPGKPGVTRGGGATQGRSKFHVLLL